MTLRRVLIAFAAAGLLAACATTEQDRSNGDAAAAGLVSDDMAQAAGQETTNAADEAVPRAYALTGEYDERSIVVPLIRLERFFMSVDRFPQYVNGDATYEQVLFELARYGYGPFEEGQTAVLELRAQAGDPERLIVGLAERGERMSWWHVEYTGEPQSVWMDVQVTDTGVPMAVRLRDPGSGELMERETSVGGGYFEAEESMGAEAIAEVIAEERSADIDRWASLVSPISVVGEEIIETRAGAFEAVHLVRESGSATIHYWVSPDVPGEIIRVATSAEPGEDEIAVELVSIE